MKKIYIIHGWGGSSSKDWIPWATEAFRERGYEVIAPDMPKSNWPQIGKWTRHLESIAPDLDQDTYFIGHSIGCQAIMRFLEKQDTAIGGAVFVSGFFELKFGALPFPKNIFAKIIARPWIETPVDFEKLRKLIPYSVSMLSDNDPFVAYGKAKEGFEQKLSSETITLPFAGHITKEDGFGAFPQLLETFTDKFE